MSNFTLRSDPSFLRAHLWTFTVSKDTFTPTFAYFHAEVYEPLCLGPHSLLLPLRFFLSLPLVSFWFFLVHFASTPPINQKLNDARVSHSSIGG